MICHKWVVCFLSHIWIIFASNSKHLRNESETFVAHTCQKWFFFCGEICQARDITAELLLIVFSIILVKKMDGWERAWDEHIETARQKLNMIFQNKYLCKQWHFVACVLCFLTWLICDVSVGIIIFHFLLLFLNVENIMYLFIHSLAKGWVISKELWPLQLKQIWWATSIKAKYNLHNFFPVTQFLFSLGKIFFFFDR